eukprot:sb/3465711/
MLRTGNFGCSTHTAASVTETDEFKVGMMMGSYCLDANLPYMTCLWQDLLTQPHFHESDRIKALLDSKDLVSEVAGTHYVTMDRSLMSVAINTTPSQVDEVVDALSELLRRIPDRVSSKDYSIDTRPFTSISAINEFIEVQNLGVNFCSRSFRGAPSAHPDSPKLSVLAALLSSKYLHREVREKGGAYGSGCVASNQAVSFFSYRDPNNTATLEVFDRAAQWAAEGAFTDEQLNEAQISVMGKQDAPVAPGSRGLGEFLGGMDLDQRRAYRAGVLSVTRQEVMDVAERYLSPDNLHGNVVVGRVGRTEKFVELKLSEHWPDPILISDPYLISACGAHENYGQSIGLTVLRSEETKSVINLFFLCMIFFTFLPTVSDVF